MPTYRNGKYPDLHEHLQTLAEQGLLHRFTRSIDKDTELHPLVRWQFRGGMEEADRKAFLFENVTDARGGAYDIPVVVGALGANRQIYGLGMGCAPEEIPDRWKAAQQSPIAPEIVSEAPCQEVVMQGGDLTAPSGGLARLPVPISTPGWDVAPFLTCSQVITRDPDTGIANMGIYRAHLKSQNRMGINFSTELTPGGFLHWKKCRRQGTYLEAAVVVGGPPVITYASIQKLPYGSDELAVAGGLLGVPVNVVRCKTVDLLVPAEAEIVIEGRISTEWLEPEAPFGESHGHVNLQELNPVMEVTAITHRKDAILLSILAQVTPSEASTFQKVAYEVQLYRHLHTHANIPSVKRVAMHEPLTNMRKLLVVEMEQPYEERDVWQALYSAASYHPAIGKIVVAVDSDIDPYDMDAVIWAMSYRMRPHEDVQIIRGKDVGHSPRVVHTTSADRHRAVDSAMLVNATLKEPYPPVSLPKREYMERARQIWEEEGLPPLKPKMPWYGYSLGAWTPKLDEAAARAAGGGWLELGEELRARRTREGEPNQDIEWE